MKSIYFTPESQMPKGSGFQMYGPQHLLMLGILGLWTAAVLLWLRRQSRAQQNRVMRVTAGVMLGMEVLKDFLLGCIGAFSIGYLPLHLCSIAMFVCLYQGAHPNSKACGQILYSVCFPGAMCALLFPDWTMFPLLHFQSLHSFVYHTLLVQMSLAPLVTGRIRPGVRQVPLSMGFLVAVSIPVGMLNGWLHTNYMFLRRPSSGSPLELLGALPGRYGYIMGYFLLVLGVVTAMNLPFSLSRWLRRCRTGGSAQNDM